MGQDLCVRMGVIPIVIYILLALNADAGEEGVLKVRVLAMENNCVHVEFENKGTDPIYLLDKLDPVWGVLSVSLLKADGTQVPLSSVRADWFAYPKNKLKLGKGEKIRRQVPVGLKLAAGDYVVQVRYTVRNDSFFMDWVKGVSDNPELDIVRFSMMTVWKGDVSSEEARFTVTEKEPAPNDPPAPPVRDHP